MNYVKQSNSTVYKMLNSYTFQTQIQKKTYFFYLISHPSIPQQSKEESTKKYSKEKKLNFI